MILYTLFVLLEMFVNFIRRQPCQLGGCMSLLSGCWRLIPARRPYLDKNFFFVLSFAPSLVLGLHQSVASSFYNFYPSTSPSTGRLGVGRRAIIYMNDTVSS